MEENLHTKIPIIGHFLKRNDEDLISKKYIIEEKLIKVYSDELNLNPENKKLIKNFEEISKKMISMGIKPKMVLNSFLVYKYSNIEDGFEILFKSLDGIWNHKYIDSDENLCFICSDIETNHRSLTKILHPEINLMKSNLEDENLKRKISERQNSLKSILNYPGKFTQNDETKIFVNLPGEKNFEKKNSEKKINVNECPICIMDIENNKDFKLSCNHKFCMECIQEYLNEEIKNSRVTKINCPMKMCMEVFEEKKIRELISEENFYKYKKFLLREKYKNNPNAVCCPIVNCEGHANKSNAKKKLNGEKDVINIQNPELEINLLNNNEINPKEKNPQENVKIKLTCNFGHELCSLCSSPWHGEENCEEDQEIKNFANLTGIIPKKCPKCRVWTEKNMGCNHMTCKICQHNWCWLCLQECLPNHYMTEGTICFGKQFNENANETDLFFIRLLMGHNIYFIATFFIFYFTTYIIFLIFHERNRENNNNNQDNSENIENENLEVNNNQGNHRDLENNVGNPLLENNINRNRIRLNIGQKIGLFLMGECLLSILFVFLVITNGFFVIPMLVLLGHTTNLTNPIATVVCFATYCFLFLIFYILGAILSCIWLVFASLYLIFKIIMD